MIQDNGNLFLSSTNTPSKILICHQPESIKVRLKRSMKQIDRASKEMKWLKNHKKYHETILKIYHTN